MNSAIIFRKATKKDVPQIVKLLATDTLGKLRENYSEPLPNAYYLAFDLINSDLNQELMVLENNQDTLILASFQLTFIPYLSYNGRMRAQIENVMVRDDLRGQGLGKEIFNWAINRAKERNAHVLQLTSDKLRPRAIKFYKDLGFIASHEGMKLHL